ncbi:MAG TPA: hypothetical protein VL068_06005, partial [Microthrixaceae bacterium]|nr:hypothetical protein [Microthrixaceae bacterium]
MRQPTDIDLLDDDLLDDFYDVGSLLRGRAYAIEDRVRLINTSEDEITATCRGSGNSNYFVQIVWSTAASSSTPRASSFVDLHDSCSCPLGGSCKHCVAVIVTARRRSDRVPEASGSSPALDWRKTLRDVTRAVPEDSQETTGLALQFAVIIPRATRFISGNPRVSLRPMRIGKSGKWIKTGASWRDVSTPNCSTLKDVDPLQRAALRSLTLTTGTNRYYLDSDALSLAQFSSDFWYHLELAIEAGVELIPATNNHSVELSPTPARASIDLSSDDTGSLSGSVEFILDDKPYPIARDDVGLIGSPAHGVWISEGTKLRLAPLSVALHPTVQRLATVGELIVPAADVGEFLDKYQPELARHALVESSDGSVQITKTQFEGFVVSIERTAITAADVSWSVRYRRGDRTSRHPLRSTEGRGRDRLAEAVAIKALRVPEHLLPQLFSTDGLPNDLQISGPPIISLFAEVIPWLESEPDVEVEFTGAHPALREATEDPLISLTVTDSQAKRDGNDWFNLDVMVSIEGETIDFVSLFAALSMDEETLILPSGTWLSLDRPEFAKLQELIDEAQSLAEPGGDGAARINRFQSSWWDELTSLGVVAK